MNVSVIIVNYNGLAFTRQCLESLFRFHTSDSFEVIIVDNNSSDGSQIELPKLFPQINFISIPENKGFGAANNVGAKKATGEFLFFVNNDTLFIQETIEKLTNFLSSHNTYGIVGPKLLNENSSFQLSFGNFPSMQTELRAKNMAESYFLQSKEEIVSNKPIRKDWVTGAALMIRRKVFESIGGFDEQFFMYFEDIDLCKAMSTKGYQSLYVPFVNLIHLGGKSYEKINDKILYEYRRSQLRYYDKHNFLFQRIIVRVYIFLKFLPKIFIKTDNKNSMNILRLVFSNHK